MHKVGIESRSPSPNLNSLPNALAFYVSCFFEMDFSLVGCHSLYYFSALSLGKMYLFVIGKDNHCIYCESGTAVKDAREAEARSKSGDVIISPYLWGFCDSHRYDWSAVANSEHIKVSSREATLDFNLFCLLDSVCSTCLCLA